jgi:hypothetical protein
MDAQVALAAAEVVLQEGLAALETPLQLLHRKVITVEMVVLLLLSMLEAVVAVRVLLELMAADQAQVLVEMEQHLQLLELL